MAATASQILRLRRMVNEPSTDAYTDVDLAARIEENPLTDSAGVVPSSSTWTPTYDLYLAASNIWAEKAAILSSQFSFSADGASFQIGQQYDHAMTLSDRFRQQSDDIHKRRQRNRKASSVFLIAYPKPVDSPGFDEDAWIGNLQEDD